MKPDLAQAIDRHFRAAPPKHLAVAVSGGSDSMALLHLARDFAVTNALNLHCVTVDHGLRAEAAEEARFVGDVCTSMGIDHTVLKWRDWDGSGNTQDAARRARYRLMADWARERGITHIMLGHTEDDQAETVLMRLGRGAGVDGLSAMSPTRSAYGILWERPLLAVSRADLRQYLVDKGQRWIDDPSNEDTRFDRIKARKALDALADLGIERTTLAQVAQHMAAARSALCRQVRDAARQLVRQHAGGLCMDLEQLKELPEEIARRLLIAAICWISRAEYAPRGRAVENVLRTVAAEGATTLEGCHFKLAGNSLWVFRELNAVCETVCDIGGIWDGRWCITGAAASQNLQIRALGQAGLSQCDDWRTLNLPRELLLSTPAVWKGSEMVAAPLVISGSEWQASLKSGVSSFHDTVFAH